MYCCVYIEINLPEKNTVSVFETVTMGYLQFMGLRVTVIPYLRYGLGDGLKREKDIVPERRRPWKRGWLEEDAKN